MTQRRQPLAGIRGPIFVIAGFLALLGVTIWGTLAGTGQIPFSP